MREALEPQNIRFSYPGETVNPFYTGKHLTFTTLSDHTYNQVGYTDVDLDDIEALGLGERDHALGRRAREARQGRMRCRRSTASPISCSASTTWPRASSSGDREDALLEYLTMVPYYFWGAYNIHEMNSSTNVTRHPDIDDDKKSPARVFTANNTPSYVNSFENLPMPTEDFVRNFGRRMHHMAVAVIDGHVADEKNVDYVVRQLSDMGTKFLAHVVGECKDDPNLKQIFSKSSRVLDAHHRVHRALPPLRGLLHPRQRGGPDSSGRSRRALRARARLRLSHMRKIGVWPARCGPDPERADLTPGVHVLDPCRCGVAEAAGPSR